MNELKEIRELIIYCLKHPVESGKVFVGFMIYTYIVTQLLQSEYEREMALIRIIYGKS